MIKLSARLQAVADMVTEGMRVADVGTDHGYIPIYLIQKGICPSAIAMDIGEGPLERAKCNILAQGLDKRILTQRSDGLKAYEPGTADSLVIAGMGGLLMRDILKWAGRNGRLGDFKELILSPHSDVDVVRRSIHELGYKIHRENMVVDSRKYYTVLHCLKGQERYNCEEDYRFGKYLIDHGHPVLSAYLEWQLQVKGELLERLKAADSDGAAAYVPALKKEIDAMVSVLEKMNEDSK